MFAREGGSVGLPYLPFYTSKLQFFSDPTKY